MMRSAARIVSIVALAATVLLPLLFFADRLGFAAMKAGLLIAAAVWFLSAPLWMEHKVSD